MIQPTQTVYRRSDGAEGYFTGSSSKGIPTEYICCFPDGYAAYTADQIYMPIPSGTRVRYVGNLASAYGKCGSCELYDYNGPDAIVYKVAIDNETPDLFLPPNELEVQ